MPPTEPFDPGPMRFRSSALRMVRDGSAVLAAILIAFALDAWWTDRDDRQRIDDILNAIVAEFEAARVQLDSVTAYNQLTIDHLAAFQRRSEPSLSQIPADSLGLIVVLPIEGFQMFDPAFGALATLISTGGLERIQNTDLRSDLGGWLGELDDIGFEQRQVEFATQRFLVAQAGELAMRDPEVPEGSPADHPRLRRLAASDPYRQASMILRWTLEDYQRDIVRFQARVRVLLDRLNG